MQLRDATYESKAPVPKDFSDSYKMTDDLLKVKNLRTYFHTDLGVAKAVDGVSLTVKKGETLCLVGESGCGKSVTALSVMRLIPSPPGRIESGEIFFKGKDIKNLSDADFRKINRLWIE